MWHGRPAREIRKWHGRPARRITRKMRVPHLLAFNLVTKKTWEHRQRVLPSRLPFRTPKHFASGLERQVSQLPVSAGDARASELQSGAKTTST